MQGNGHPSLHTKKAGFVVNIEKSWLGFSPDAWVHNPSVDCTDGTAEFKCPYTMADITPEEMCDQKSFYLVSLNGIPCLKRDHEYYHQVQLQLYVTRSMAKWCDFCVYSLRGVFVQRIFPDKCCQKYAISKLDNFFTHILLELKPLL